MVKKTNNIVEELKFVARGIAIGVVVLVIWRVFHIDHYLSIVP
jgi:hypothetical protein